jgi:hypothetical protein
VKEWFGCFGLLALGAILTGGSVLAVLSILVGYLIGPAIFLALVGLLLWAASDRDDPPD